MIYLNIKQAKILHDSIIEISGGLAGYNQNQIGYLESILAQIQNDSYYPKFIDKLTHLIYFTAKFHPFLDGNKITRDIKILKERKCF